MLRGWGEGPNKRMAGKGWSRLGLAEGREGRPTRTFLLGVPAPCCLSGPLDSADQLAGGLG